MLNLNAVAQADITCAVVEPSTLNSMRTRRNLALFIAALDAGFTAVGQKAEDNRTNPFWLEVETFDGLIRVLFENAAPFITLVSRSGRRCEYGINRPGAIVVNQIESLLIQ